MSIDTGGPAYPVQDASAPCAIYGMTLLDAFAIAAMPELIKRADVADASVVASVAYLMARAMLAEKRRLEGAE